AQAHGLRAGRPDTKGAAREGDRARGQGRQDNLAARLAHDVHAAVDVDGLAGETPCVGRSEVGAGEADVVDVDQLADRLAARGFVQQQVEVLEARGGAGLERPGRDRMHADALLAEL